MRKFITIVFLVVALLAVTNVSYGVPPEWAQNGGKIKTVNVTVGEGATSTYTDATTDVENNITDNSVYTEINPTELLNPAGYIPSAEKLFEDELHISKSVFDLQRKYYSYKELTRFANPGRFLGFLWPEWSNKYSIEINTFKKYPATQAIYILPADDVQKVLGLIKIGEGQAFAKDLNKSEHQVMAALAFRATQAGAKVIVYKTFSNPLVKVDSFVLGGGGTQVGAPASIFNGASGIGTSSNETLTRASVIAELYR